MTAASIRVWDLFIRVFHWSLVLLFIISYITGEEESPLHVYSGYTIVGLIVLRLIWGLIGSRHARFTDFLRSPAAAIRYLQGLMRGDAPRYLGHNPAAGWMIVLLLLSLLATAGSGLMVYGLEGGGPLAGRLEAQTGTPPALASAPFTRHHEDEHDDDDDEHEYAAYATGGALRPDHDDEDDEEHEAEEFWEEIHEFFAHLCILLIVLHVAGVAASSLAHGENLVRAMVTGFKPAEQK